MANHIAFQTAIAVLILASAARAQQAPFALEPPAPARRDLEPARGLLRSGETFEAVRVLRRIEAERPRDAEVALLLAHAYYLSGQKKLFTQKAARAAELAPSNPAPAYALGRHYLDGEGRVDLAAEQFARALRAAPDHAPSRYHVGWIHELEGRTGEALADYRAAARSGYWLGMVGLSRLALVRDDVAEAVRQARAAVVAAPSASMAHAASARALERTGALREAMASYERASSLDPADATLLYRLARCAQSAGDEAAAKDALRRHDEVRSVYGAR